MTGPVRAAAQREVHAPLEEAIQDRLGEVAIMHYLAQGRQRFVRRQQNRPTLEIPFVDDAIEHVRRVGSVREIAQLVDNQNVRMEVRCEAARAGLSSPRGRARRLIVRADEARLVAMLNGAIRDGDAEMRFPRAAWATEDRVLPLAHELRAQVAAEHLEFETRLEGEVEVVDRAEKRSALCAPRA